MIPIIPIILWVWVGTFVISFYTDIKNALNILKKAADEGYKINFNNLDNLSGFVSDVDMDKKTVLEWFIPFHNLRESKKRQDIIKNTSDIIIRQFRITGVLEDMNEEEIKEYQKNPTLFNALHIAFDPLSFDKEYIKINNIEEKLSMVEKEIKDTRLKDIEELKKLREEILTLYKADSREATIMMADGFLHRLDEIESMDTENIDDEPKLKKKI